MIALVGHSTNDLSGVTDCCYVTGVDLNLLDCIPMCCIKTVSTQSQCVIVGNGSVTYGVLMLMRGKVWNVATLINC